MLYIIFQYGWELFLIEWIFGFEAIMESFSEVIPSLSPVVFPSNLNLNCIYFVFTCLQIKYTRCVYKIVNDKWNKKKHEIDKEGKTSENQNIILCLINFLKK